MSFSVDDDNLIQTAAIQCVANLSVPSNIIILAMNDNEAKEYLCTSTIPPSTMIAELKRYIKSYEEASKINL